MANVQLEKGYTRIANEILENIIRLPLNGTQLRIIVVIWRNTYGFGRKEHTISESYIAKATGLSKRFISQELNKLVEMNIIKVAKNSTYTTPKTLAFNKDFEKWGYGTILPQVNGTSTEERKQDTTEEQLFHTTVEEHFHQQINTLKKELKKNEHEEFFESIWKLYPKKKGKGQVSDNQKKKLFRIGIEEMTRAIERYKKEKAETDMQYWQNGSTFFNSGYIDYLDANYVEAEEKPTWGWR
ncbi:MAG: replication protein [Caulobacteraceae bacterium]